MRRLWRIVRWVSAGIVGLALIVAAAVAVFTRTARFNDFLRVRLVAYLVQTYRGQITIGSIEGSVWGSLTLRDIEVRHGGSDIVSISQLRVGYQILPALRRQLVLSDIDVIKPELHLARDSDGRWNLLAAIAERNPSPPSPPSDVTIALRRLAIEQAAVSVTTASSATYRLSNGNLNGSGNMGPSGQSFKVDTITLALSGPGMLPVRARGAVDYNEAARIATIKVPSFSISTDRSRIDLSATLRDLSAKNVNATVNLRKLAAADINSLAPQANLARDLSGTVRINGNAADLHGVVALAAGDARLNTSLKADISKSKPIWSIQAQLAKVDLRKLLNRKNPQELPAGVINAAVRADGIGTSTASAKGGMDARVTGLALTGMRFGDVSLAAAVKDQVASLKVALAGPSGGAQLSGRIAIAKQPAYNLHLALAHLRPGSLIHVAGIPPADLNLTSTIDGSGYQPLTMRTRVQLRWLPSTLGAIRIDGGRVEAQLASGIVQISDASLRAGGTSVGANGQVALNPNGSGRIRYKVLVGQASDWLALAGRKGSGRIDLTGQAQGNLRNLRTSGSVDLSSLRVDRYSVGHARLTYDIAGLGKPLRPDGQLMLISTDLRAGVELKSLRTSIRLIPGVTQTAVVSLSAEDRGSHPAGLRAEVAYKPGNVVVNLTQMAVTTGDGSWQLTAPAQLTQRGRAIEIRRFAAANHNQSLTLDGTISQAGPQDLTLHVQSLRLDDFSGFVPGQVKPVGLASANLAVRGSAAAPVITMAANVSDLRVSSIPQAEFSARLSYSGGKAQAEATLSQNATHSLNATAMLPLQLSWAQGFQSRVTGDLDLRAFSSGLDLAVINAFRNPQVSGIGGILSLDVRAHGPLQHPIPGGFIRLSGGHAKAGKLNVEVTEGSADIQLGAREVRLVTLSARAGEGTLTGGGALTLEPNGTPGQLSLHVALDRWPAIATHQYNAAISERIDAGGPLTALNIRGRVEVLHGVFRPDLSVAGGAPRPDETVTVVHRWSETSHRRPSPPVKNQATTGPTFQNLAIDVDIAIDRNTWIKTADFAVEMEGDVYVQKRRAEELILSGAINTVRGTLVVAGREFDLARGHIMFTGGHEINPELDIVAQRRVQNYLLSATVGGSANKPTLTLSSIPDLPQADILSVMMFGKPSNQLSGGQQKDLQSQALSMAGSYAASQVGQAVAQALGLGELGVTTSSSGVGFGRYLTQNVYVSASQSASNMQDRKAEMQYYLTPSINLGTSASTNYGNEIKLQWHKEY